LLQNCLMPINAILVGRAVEREGPWERLNADGIAAR
jgi:hypothetical protein